MVLAVVHMAPDTMPSASPERTIIVPAWQGRAWLRWQSEAQHTQAKRN
jgi:hypothetical protein